MPTNVAHLAVAEVGFLPHGFCYSWNTPLLVTHVAADLLIGTSYVVISLALVTLVHRARRDIPFHVLFVAFGLFIVACGMTHFMEIWTLWHPAYWLAGGVKVVTAAASVTTAAVMPWTVPRVLTTVRNAGLARAREIAAARAEALTHHNAMLQSQADELARQNALLEAQAIALEHQTAEAQALAQRWEQTNQALRQAVTIAEAARQESDAARAEAEAANRAKSDFLANMSHELRTPLNAIGGYVELVDLGVHGPVTDAQHGAFARVQKAQTHLLALINDLLNYSRLEAGRVAYDMRPVNVRHVVAEVLPLVEPQLKAKRLVLTVDLAATETEPPCLAWADHDKLVQVLVNLLSNAIKFTDPGPDGPGRITLSTAVRTSIVRHASTGDRDAGFVFVRVTDTGRGIPREKQDAIFEPFVQVRAAGRVYSQAIEGTGLGLSISRDLARGMGGDLRVRSREGQGATFTVALRQVVDRGDPPAVSR